MRGHTEREHHYKNKQQKKERRSRSETKTHRRQRNSHSEQMVYRELQRLAEESIYREDFFRETGSAHSSSKQDRRAEGCLNQERGRKSEQRLFDYLTDESTFPWIQKVTIAQKSQEGYDFTIHLKAGHQLYKMLNGSDIYVDAKSSSSGVNNYFLEQSSRCKKNPKQVITMRKRIAINAGPEATQDEMDLQLTLQILVLCDALFDDKKTDEVLLLLGERLTKVYHEQLALMDQYLYYYLRSYGPASTIVQ